MIERTIYKQILHSISVRPVTLITGARQVGKTTLCLKLRDEKGFGHVSLRDKDERAMARGIPTQYPITAKGVLCLTEKLYPIEKGIYALPVSSI
jgi:hypothetical protein